MGLRAMKIIKRYLAAAVLTLSVIAILVAVGAAAAILVVVAAPFIGAAMAINFMEQTKGNY